MSRAKRTINDNITFASKIESDRYDELKLLQRAGYISKLECHPSFVLRPKFKNNKGKTISKWTYTADFQYIENGVTVVEDVKGTKSNGQPFIRRWQKPSLDMFQYQNPDIDFRIVAM